MRKLAYIIVFSIILFISTAVSQDKTSIEPEFIKSNLPYGLIEFVPKPKPVVALALSGGGSRGLSQIGVLKALEEFNINIDLIVGTSMGSIVGGLYASGYTIEELNSIALTTNWNELLTISRQSDRRELFIDQKITEDKSVFTLRLDGLKPILPTSFNDGQKLSNELNILTFNAPLHSKESFDLLNKKFRAVCTNLITGDPVVLSSGTLSKAMRASSSVAFFLPPVQLDSLLLVDGGLVENIPVGTARKEGGEIIIAVNSTSPLHKEEKLSAPWIIADQIVSIPMKHLNTNQIKNADIIINPELNDRESTNFSDIEKIIEAGYKSGLSQVSEIARAIDSVYLINLAKEERYFKNPKLTGELSSTEREVLYNHILTDSVSNKEILRALYELQSHGNYADIKMDLVEYDDHTELTLVKKANPLIIKADLIGSTAINSERTGEIFSSLVGQSYNGRAILKTIIELLREYRKIGYSLANISEISFDPETGRLGLFIDEGIISEIVTEGNSRTNPTIITREFPISEGDYFNIDKISKGLINLRSTKLFEDAEAVLKKENGKNILIIKVVERPTGLLRLGFGVDNENRARLGFDLREENLLGTGSEIGLLLNLNSRGRGIQLEQKSNRIFNTYLTYKINAFYNFNDVFVYRDLPTVQEDRFSREENGEYRQIFFGGSLGVGAQVERFGNLIFEGKYQINKVKNLKNNLVNPFEIKIVSFKVSTTVDTQDKYPYPEKGIYFNGFYETSQSFLGGDIGYTNVGFEYRNFLSLSSASVISTRINMGFGDKTLPLTQQYSLGGMNSFYGMRDYEYRGRQLFLTSLMFRYKLPFVIFFDTYFMARYDLGNVWEIQEQIKFKNLKHGVGAAISFDTPIGPAEFALGRSFLFRKDIPTNPVSWGDVLFYFSIGYYY